LKHRGGYLTGVGLTRIFGKGGGGRWYQKGGNSYQQLPGEDREKLLLDGDAVVELDYPAMHPHLLYAWEGKQCPDDFYEKIATICGGSRFLAKSVWVAAINAPSYASLSSGINLNKAQEVIANRDRAEPEPIMYDEMKSRGLKPRDMIGAIEQAHPVIAKYLFSNSANRLMLDESEVVTSVLFRLMDQCIPSLPVHDSVIAPIYHKKTVRKVMEGEYFNHTGCKIEVR
jgi:hypothetical protein